MALPKEDSTSRNIMTNLSQEYSIIKNRSYSKVERMAMVRVMTDRLHLTLDDIRNSVNSDRLKSLSIVPPDLLPFELTLSDGNTVTVMETDPVVTCYDGELTNVKGNIIHIYEKNEQDLPGGSILPQKRYTVNAQSLEKILPLIIKDFSKSSPEDSNSYVIPGTSKKIDTPSNIDTRIEEHSKTEVSSTVIASDSKIISPKYPETTKNMNVSNKKNSDDVPSDTNHTVGLEKISPQPKDHNVLHDSPPFSSKFQVIGLVDTGIIRDSGSEEGLHNVVEDVENKDWIPRKEMATIIVDKELSNPSEFRAVFLKTPSPVLRKKPLDVRKSARAPKPKIRSSFKSWDELKIRLPRHSRKGRSSKSTKLTDKKTKVKKN